MKSFFGSSESFWFLCFILPRECFSFQKILKKWKKDDIISKKKNPVIFYLFSKTCFLSEVHYMNELKYLILISQNNTWQLWNCTSSIQVADWWHQTHGSISWCGLLTYSFVLKWYVCNLCSVYFISIMEVSTLQPKCIQVFSLELDSIRYY